MIILSLLGYTIIAQQTYFNKRYDIYQGSCEGGSSILVDSGRIFILIGTCDGTGFPGLVASVLLEIDLNGNTLDTFLYSIPYKNIYPGNSGSLSKTVTGFLFAGSMQDSIQVDAMLVKLDNNGDTVWIRTYGDTAFQSGTEAKQISDGNILLCGQASTYNGKDDMLFLKTDSSGNLIWQKHYGDNIGSEYAFSFTQTSDSGFALAGWRRIPGPSNDLYLVKTDSSGNLQWDVFFGSQWSEGIWSIISTQDGNIVIAGNYACCNMGQSIYPYIAKFDLQGNMLWEKKYGTPLPNTGFYSVHELFDGSLIAAGSYDTAFAESKGLLIKLTNNGDTIWANAYYSNINSDSEFRDVYPTPDGGFIACGAVYPQLPDTGNKDVWVVKVDSLGCEVSNCIVGIYETLNKELIKVYPNPFSSDINIEFSEPIVRCRIEMYDMKGIKLKEIFFETENKYKLKTDELPIGLFLLNIYNNNKRVYSGKITHLQ